MKTTGIRSEAMTAAYWRMQFESCQGALAEIIAENTENVEALRDVVVDYGDRCDDHAGCQCSMARAARLVAHIAPTPHPTDSDARALQDTQAEAGETGAGHGNAE